MRQELTSALREYASLRARTGLSEGADRGYDSHKDDCGAGITDCDYTDYQALTRYVLDVTRRNNCPVLSVRGGGYKLPVTITAAASHVEVLAEYK